MHRIIYVDDSPDARLLMKYAVRDTPDFELTAAAADTEAFSAIDENNADIVLADMMMPEVSGFDVLRYAIARHYSVALVTSVPGVARELLARAGLGGIPVVDKRDLAKALPALAAELDAQPWRRDNHEP